MTTPGRESMPSTRDRTGSTRDCVSYTERISALEDLRLKSFAIYRRQFKGETGTNLAEVKFSKQNQLPVPRLTYLQNSSRNANHGPFYMTTIAAKHSMRPK